MDKKRSVGITLLGWMEITIGIIGTLIFLYSLTGAARIILSGLFDSDNNGGMTASFVGGVFIFLALLFLPMPFLLCAGIGILRLKSWARKVNIFVMPPLTFSLLLLNLIPGVGSDFLLATIFSALLLGLLPILFFNIPEIKVQFK